MKECSRAAISPRWPIKIKSFTIVNALFEGKSPFDADERSEELDAKGLRIARDLKSGTRKGVIRVSREQPVETNEYQSVDRAEGEFFEAVRRRTFICWRKAQVSPQPLPATGSGRRPPNQ